MNTLLLTLALLAAAPPGVDVSVELEPPVIPYHEQAEFSVIVEAPADARVKLPDMVGRFGGLEVYGKPGYSQVTLDDGRKRIEETYRLDAVWPNLYSPEPVTVETFLERLR